MQEPLETAELLAFTRIVEARSLSRAAAELRVPRATIGRRLQRLEEQLGVRLLRRTTRTLALTEAGEQLYRHARIVLDAVRQAEASVRQRDDVVRGDLRVATLPLTTDAFFGFLSRFAERYPEVRLHVDFSTRHVDLLREGYDVAFRGTTQLEPGLIARVLGKTPLIAVASAEYLKLRGTPRSVRDLRQHSCLLSFARGELAQTYWIDKQGKKIQVAASFAANDIRVLKHMAVRGRGIAVLPQAMIEHELARGKLVRVLERAFDSVSRVALVYPDREFLPTQVRAFVDMLSAWVAEEGDAVLWPPPGRDDEPPAKRKRSKDLN